MSNRTGDHKRTSVELLLAVATGPLWRRRRGVRGVSNARGGEGLLSTDSQSPVPRLALQSLEAGADDVHEGGLHAVAELHVGVGPAQLLCCSLG